jgi:hypothetical protein
MRIRTRLLAAVVLAVALFAATVAVGHADEYVLGEVASLSHFVSQGYFVEIQSTSDRVRVQVSEELWNQLEVGDTMRLSGDTWSLLHKGPSEGATGTGDNANR